MATSAAILKRVASFNSVPRRASEAHPMHGTTLYIGTCKLETVYGHFVAYVFQELITKGYIIALAYGEIHKAKKLYTRLHSSCVTSETLRGCDCDCSKQLEGALRCIARKKAGILFYLMQEGRGVGFVAKARDRMLVQASRDSISTFEAYHALGLRKDYRNYESIPSICHLLGVRAGFVVLTNNPDKLEALQALGMKIHGSERIEFDPGPYNLAYLKSKSQGGHILKKPSSSGLRSVIPPEPIEVFNPSSIDGARRFVFSARYYLPMKPVDGEILLTARELAAFKRKHSLSALLGGKKPLLKRIEQLDPQRCLLHVDRDAFRSYRKETLDGPVNALLTTPYWFAVHVYFDIVSGQEFVVLVHGKARGSAAPLVRIHSESIFDRFPLTDLESRNKFKASAKLIVRAGYGLIVLLHNDGRGAGLGAHVIARSLHDRDPSASSAQAYKALGVEYDLRDYQAAMQLIWQHVPKGKIQMILNSPEDFVRKTEYSAALAESALSVKNWVFLETQEKE
jgi:3,4-dihydroxy 2-butanone 4-phosphate synthase/GTP cyclohydrolase II